MLHKDVSDDECDIDDVEKKDGDESIFLDKKERKSPPFLKKLCLLFLAKNFNFTWNNKNIVRPMLSNIGFDKQNGETLIKFAEIILQSITKIEKTRKTIRQDKIEHHKEDLLKSKVFVKGVSSTAALFETLGYVGISYGINKAIGVSASTLISIFAISPVVCVAGTLCSICIVTPAVAEKIATCIVDHEDDKNSNQVTSKEMTMLPPCITIMKR